MVVDQYSSFWLLNSMYVDSIFITSTVSIILKLSGHSYDVQSNNLLIFMKCAKVEGWLYNVSVESYM